MIDVATLNPQRKVAYEVLKDLSKGGVCAEIGVYQGGLSEIILDVADPKSLTLIDPWQWSRQWFVRHSEDEMQLIGQGDNTNEGDEIFRSIQERFGSDPRVTIWRMGSVQGAERMRDESLDWAFIDGDHRYQAVVEDLAAWWPKIKRGGFLWGDDYNSKVKADKHQAANGVAYAVDEFSREKNLTNKALNWEEGGRGFFLFEKS